MSDMTVQPGGAAANDGVRQLMAYDANKKSVGVAYAFWFFLGLLGVHRLYLKKTLSGLLMLALLVGSFFFFGGGGIIGWLLLGLWALIDAFLIPGMVRSHNNRLIAKIV